MRELQEETIKERRKHIRSYAQGYGVLPSIRMGRNIVNKTRVFVRYQEDHHEGRDALESVSYLTRI
jgi:hypothetical protein